MGRFSARVANDLPALFACANCEMANLMAELYVDPRKNRDLAGPWYRDMKGYHWFVLVVASLGWLFDCLDQQIFVLSRPAAMRDLLSKTTTPAELPAMVREYSAYATSIFLIGWATGGLIFGILGDRIGRAKTMLFTILLYSLFTGLSSLSQGFWDFALYRFLTGLGVGGEFAVGVSLVAEVMPERARPAALTLLQMLSAVGNMSAAFINVGMGVLEEQGMVHSPWRKMYLIGAIPALLALVVRWKLKEPERWKQVSAEQVMAKQLGSYRALFGNPVWRRNALVGVTLAFSGVVGLWAVGFFSPDLTDQVLRQKVIANVFEDQSTDAQGDSARLDDLGQLRELRDQKQPIPAALADLNQQVNHAIEGQLGRWRGITAIMLQTGGFFGMFGFGYLAGRIGRKPTFAIGFTAACFVSAAVFWFLNDFSELFWMMPMLGFFQMSIFAGYAMYFPELFPTHLRSTGTSFCYNVGRFVAATGPFIQGKLTRVFADTPEPLRYAGVAMCSVFLIGLLVLPFAPETKGKPLPE